MNQQRRSRELERADQRAPVSQTNKKKLNRCSHYHLEVMTNVPLLFPGLFLYVYVKSPSPKKNQKPHTISNKPQNPIQDLNPQNPNPP